MAVAGLVSGIYGAVVTVTDSLVFTTCMVLLGTYVLYKLTEVFLHIKSLQKWFKDVPGPTDRHWWYGHMHLFPKSAGERVRFFMRLGSKFRRYYCIWVGPARVTVVVNHPSTVKDVMKTSEPKPTGFSGMYRFGIPWLGRGLLISAGERWSRSRRLLTPAFHFDILKPYVNIYNEAAERLMKNLDEFAASGEKFEVFNNISRCTLDIILRCAFSYETDCQKKGPPHPYLTAVNELSHIWWEREKILWIYPDFLFYMTAMGRQFRKNCEYVHIVAEEIIKNRKKTLEESGGSMQRKYLDFLDILLTAKDENGEGMSLLDIRNEVDTFMFEGHDTTSSSISWTLYALAVHQDCQQRAQQEIDRVLHGRGTDHIEWKDLTQLEYLTMCLKEGLRQYSPVPFIQREFTHDFEVEGRKFPAGTPVTVHIAGVHHNEDVWDNPNEFNPERFSKDNLAEMDSYQFVPFSAGPRNCIGQHFALNEEKVVVARLLRRYTFHVDPDHEVERKIAAVLKAKDGIVLYCTRRDQSDTTTS